MLVDRSNIIPMIENVIAAPTVMEITQLKKSPINEESNKQKRNIVEKNGMAISM